MAEETPRRRTGGRSARVVQTVLDAAESLIAERGHASFSIADLAERSGVHHASIYRRWGSTEAVVLALATARLESESPMPETGSLRGDLIAFAHGVAESVEGPQGLAFLRAVLAASSPSESTPGEPLIERGETIQAMLDRAADRGEPRVHFTDVLDGVLAPIYFRRLFNIGHVDDAYLTSLVDRLISASSAPAAAPARSSSTTLADR